MKNKIKWDKMVPTVLIILTAVFLRLVPHPPNFAPIAALALFTGAHFSKKSAIIISVSTMFISDLILGLHATMPFVYGSFILMIFIGRLLKNNQKIHTLAGASLISSLLFFIITNFGVWLVYPMYPRTLLGLVNSYTMAIPFFKNSILGDLIYTFSFFKGFHLISVIINHRIILLKARK